MHEAQGRKGKIQYQFQDIGTSELYKVALHNRYQALEIETPKRSGKVWKVWKKHVERHMQRSSREKEGRCKPWLSRDTDCKVSERRKKKEVVKPERPRWQQGKNMLQQTRK